MYLKSIFVLVILFGLVFCASPSWVQRGVVLTYNVGSSPTTFTVTGVSGEQISIETRQGSSSTTHTIVDNSSATYGQFWFDQNRLSEAYLGQTIGDFSVTDSSDQTFAGKEWHTITLVGTLSGARTTKILDMDTGLLLQQNVSVSGAPAVTISQIVIPALNIPPASASPPPATPSSPPQVPSSTPPATPTSTSSGTQPANPGPSSNSSTPTVPSTPAANYTPSDASIAATVPFATVSETDKKSGSCCLPAMILVMLFGLVFLKTRN